MKNASFKIKDIQKELEEEAGRRKELEEFIQALIKKSKAQMLESIESRAREQVKISEDSKKESDEIP